MIWPPRRHPGTHHGEDSENPIVGVGLALCWSWVFLWIGTDWFRAFAISRVGNKRGLYYCMQRWAEKAAAPTIPPHILCPASQQGKHDTWAKCWCSSTKHLIGREGSCVLRQAVSGSATCGDEVWVLLLASLCTTPSEIVYIQKLI